ncbi:hypothetical protein SAMN02745866_00373 [Alteromonadaceae bacterium Bs31]|nr:hypothetical protein SAMN02745866_00373 [Alteromonadaceae bacterium Bs31]
MHYYDTGTLVRYLPRVLSGSMLCKGRIESAPFKLGQKDKHLNSEMRERDMNDNDKSHKETKIEAAVFKRLLEHLDAHKEVQNIELMNLASFCRNCLAKWYVTAAQSEGMDVDYEQARERIYGIPYTDWKEKYQTPATPEQMKVFKQKHS